MGLIGMVGKVVLVTVNVLLVMLSLVMLVLGIIVVAGGDIYNSLLSRMEDALKMATSQLGTTVDTSNFTLSEFILPLAYALIALAVVIGGVSLIGCLGACYTIKIVLIVYVIIVSAIFLVQVVIVVLVYADKSTLDRAVKPHIKDSIKGYSGIEGSDATSLAWNALMNFEGCCGVDDYTDFQNLTTWPAPINNMTISNLRTPVICCKNKTTTDYACALSPSDTNNYWKTGCYDKLFDLILSNALVITIIVLTVAAQGVLVFFAIWILCTMDNKIDII